MRIEQRVVTQPKPPIETLIVLSKQELQELVQELRRISLEYNGILRPLRNQLGAATFVV